MVRHSCQHHAFNSRYSSDEETSHYVTSASCRGPLRQPGGGTPPATPTVGGFEKVCVFVCRNLFARCWSQVIYTVCLPNLLSGIYHEKTEERDNTVRLIKRLWEAVLHAEQMSTDPTTSGSVREALNTCLEDMAWNRGQVARESYQVLVNSGWDHQNEEVRKLCFYLFASPANTKHFLEDTFSHLADLVKRMARNLRMTKTFGLQ